MCDKKSTLARCAMRGMKVRSGGGGKSEGALLLALPYPQHL